MASVDLARNAHRPDGRDMTPGEKHRTPPVSELPADTAALFKDHAP